MAIMLFQEVELLYTAIYIVSYIVPGIGWVVFL